jgi:hypothetical protein
MAKTSSIPQRDSIQFDHLPLNQALPLIVILSIALWVAAIGVVCFGWLAISYLTGI